MVGMFLKDRDVQYVANRDEVTHTWRILDSWHADLMNLGPEDDIPDDSSALTVLTEGAFISIVKEAAKLGVLQNAAFEGHTALEDENMALREQILALEKDVGNTNEQIQHVQKSESFLLKEMAMKTMLKLTSMSDIENLTKD